MNQDFPNTAASAFPDFAQRNDLAERFYDAAAEGIKAISQQWGEQPGLVTPIAIEVKAPTITHELTLQRIQRWLDSGCDSPKDKVAKDQVRKKLGG